MGSKQKASRLMFPTCPVQAACEGTVLTRGRDVLGLCRKCEEALSKRGKSIMPRGINTKEGRPRDE
jgi:hypothetical protein